MASGFIVTWSQQDAAFIPGVTTTFDVRAQLYDASGVKLGTESVVNTTTSGSQAGGGGTIPGVIVGALVLVGLPGLLREFEEYRFLAYGAAVVAVMVLRPQGLVPNVRRSRELQDEERAQDEWAKAAEEGETPPEIATATGATT